MSFDELLLLRAWLERNNRISLGLMAWLVATGFGMAAFVNVFTVAAYLCSATAYFGVWCRYEYRENLYHKELDRRWDRLNFGKFQLVESAVSWFGIGSARLAIIECHESHIAGDCPLCGAD